MTTSTDNTWTVTDKATGETIQGNMPTSVSVKRQVKVKTVVTEEFRTRATSELSKEVEQIDHQLEQLEMAYNNGLQQLEQLSNEGQNVLQPRAQLEQDMQGKRNQMMGLKQEVTKQLGNLDTVTDGDTVITGMLESTVELHVGDNIYDRVRNTVVIVKDGVVQGFENA